jgi:hypothetical protein
MILVRASMSTKTKVEKKEKELPNEKYLPPKRN